MTREPSPDSIGAARAWTGGDDRDDLGAYATCARCDAEIETPSDAARYRGVELCRRCARRILAQRRHA